ncbi:peptide ABC transporter substrate-binding protein [Bacillus andreraoultii]|uniref:peptide ABC transporter substrate-binding protein n=1 Tax=Bacillus andreraoultii TaxID=1499685 RepID=UPI000539EBB2|nr:peptide ABC transporter substrate-binding protein [Bacillus andreraoultii]
MKLKNWTLALMLGLLVSILAACGGGNDEGSKSKSGSSGETGEKVISFVNGDTIPTMDPSLATDEYGFQFLGSTMEGLYRLGEDGQATEGIAKDHDVSKDGLTYTFHLREDAVWSNGDPVTANDFVYAWRRAVDPKTGSEYGPYMMGGVIKNATAISSGKEKVEALGVTAKDDHTLVVELESPTPYFETLTTFGTFLPLNEKFVEEQGDKFATSSDTLVFNGPFQLANWTSTANKWDLVKNDKYWDADTVQVDKITHTVVKDAQTAVELYESGEVDRAGLSSDLVDVYASSDDYEIYPEMSVSYLKMNQTRNKALANKNIRQAIARAFNKDDIVNEILNNGSIVANGLVPKDFVTIPDSGKDFREANGDLLTYDLKTAQEFWKKGLAEIGVDKVQIELLGDDSENAKISTEYIANQLQTNLPGLTVKIKNVPFEQRLNLDDNQDYDLEVSVWGPDYLDPKTFLDLWVTDGGNNKMGYSNKEFDKLIEETSTKYAADNEKRYENFMKAEKLLLEEDAAIAPIYQRARAQLVSPRVEGVISNPFGAKYEYKWAKVAE